MIDQVSENIVDNSEPSIQDLLLDNSRITPAGNGSSTNKLQFNQPTGGQKWWAAVIIGFIFALISSPPAYAITSSLRGYTQETIKKISYTDLFGLFIHTIIFIIVIRIILW